MIENSNSINYYYVLTPFSSFTPKIITREKLNQLQRISINDAYRIWNDINNQLVTNHCIHACKCTLGKECNLGLDDRKIILIKCDFFTLFDLLTVRNDVVKYHIVRVIQKDEVFTGIYIPSLCSNEIKIKFDEYNNKSNSVIDNTQLLLQQQIHQQQQPQIEQQQQFQQQQQLQKSQQQQQQQQQLQLLEQQQQEIQQLKQQHLQVLLNQQQKVNQLKQQQQQLQQQQLLLQQQQHQQQRLQQQSIKRQERTFQIEPFKVMSYIEITTRKMKKMVIEIAINNSNNNNTTNSNTASQSQKQPKQSVTQSSSTSTTSTKQSKKGKKTKKSKSKDKESNSSEYNNIPITISNISSSNNSSSNNSNNNNIKSPKKRKENYIQKETEIKRPKINLRIDEENLKDFIINSVLPKYIGNNNLNEKLIIEEVRRKYNTIFLTDDSLKNMVLSILNKLPSNMVKTNNCSKCHNNNRDGAKFCDFCGNKLMD